MLELSTCPECGSGWNEVRQGWDGQPESYSRLLGIEDPELYDGISWWQCPDCHTTWNRFSGEKVSG